MNGRGEFRRLVKEAAKLGFIYDGLTGTNHHRFRHQDTGRMITAAQSPSCPHSWKQALREMKRALKGQVKWQSE